MSFTLKKPFILPVLQSERDALRSNNAVDAVVHLVIEMVLKGPLLADVMLGEVVEKATAPIKRGGLEIVAGENNYFRSAR